MMPNYEEQAPKGMNLKKVWLGVSVRRCPNRAVCFLSCRGFASLFRASPGKGLYGRWEALHGRQRMHLGVCCFCAVSRWHAWAEQALRVSCLSVQHLACQCSTACNTAKSSQSVIVSM